VGGGGGGGRDGEGANTSTDLRLAFFFVFIACLLQPGIAFKSNKNHKAKQKMYSKKNQRGKKYQRTLLPLIAPHFTPPLDLNARNNTAKAQK